MNVQQWLSVLGAGAGALGSVVTAFSLNWIIRELNTARGFIEITVGLLAEGAANIPVFQGLDDRYHRAARWGTKLLWLGVMLLALGFAFQAASIWMTADATAAAAK